MTIRKTESTETTRKITRIRRNRRLRGLAQGCSERLGGVGRLGSAAGGLRLEFGRPGVYQNAEVGISLDPRESIKRVPQTGVGVFTW